jgi:hypothetical protein
VGGAFSHLDVPGEGDVQDELRVVVAAQGLPLARQPLIPVCVCQLDEGKLFYGGRHPLDLEKEKKTYQGRSTRGAAASSSALSTVTRGWLM